MYYYENQELPTYCKNHDINYSTIYTRIWKDKRKPKYAHLSEQEIVNRVVKSYKKRIKFYYKNQTLREYCNEHDLNYATMYERAINQKMKYPNKTNDEIVIMVMENYENSNYQYFYDEMPLIDYCRLHPENKYRTIIGRINKAKKENPEVDVDAVIDNYINSKHKGPFRYYYLGIPLKEYCEANGINYDYFLNYMRYHRKDLEYQNKTDDEVVEIAMSNFQPFEYKYFYKGQSLYQYCIDNNFPYSSVVTYVKRKKVKNPDADVNALIDEAIKNINRYGFIYYYQGIPLVEYAKNNNLNINTIRKNIIKRVAKSSLPLQVIVNECVEDCKTNKKIKYYYKGQTLSSFCHEHDIAYNTIIYNYVHFYANRTDITRDEAIEEIVDNYLANPPLHHTYYFGQMTVREYCKVSDYSYYAIIQRIQKLKKDGTLLNDDEIVKTVIKDYEKKLEMKGINDLFKDLKHGKIKSLKELEYVSRLLKIKYENVLELIDMNFTYNQAISTIWYFHDQTDESEQKYITDKKILSLFDGIKTLKKEEIPHFSSNRLVALIAIYKSDLLDTRSIIINQTKRYISSIVFSLCTSYNVPYSQQNFEDFTSELQLILIKLIDNIFLYNEGQIIKYLDMSLKGYFRHYLKKYLHDNPHITSLDQVKYPDERQKVALIDTLSNTQDSVENKIFTSNSFGEEMKSALLALNEDDLKFIILRFENDYSYDELSEYYQKDIEDIKEWEKGILKYLQKSPDIQKLKFSLSATYC